MAEVTNNLAMFPNVVASLTYDDATLRILRVGVVNNSTKNVGVTVIRLTPPKRTYSHTWIPGGNESFSLPNGIDFSVDVEGNITMTGLEIYMGYG